LTPGHLPDSTYAGLLPTNDWSRPGSPHNGSVGRGTLGPLPRDRGAGSPLVLGSVAQPPSRIRFTTKPAPPAYRFGVDAKFTTNMSIPRRVAIMVRNAIRPVSVNNSRGQRWVVSNRIRHTTLSRHVLSELTTLGLPRLQAMLSETVAFGEISFSGSCRARAPQPQRSRR
jgi:hypothetical protein